MCYWGYYKLVDIVVGCAWAHLLDSQDSEISLFRKKQSGLETNVIKTKVDLVVTAKGKGDWATLYCIRIRDQLYSAGNGSAGNKCMK
jgi:hypothetical protein